MIAEAHSGSRKKEKEKNGQGAFGARCCIVTRNGRAKKLVWMKANRLRLSNLGIVTGDPGTFSRKIDRQQSVHCAAASASWGAGPAAAPAIHLVSGEPGDDAIIWAPGKFSGKAFQRGRLLRSSKKSPKVWADSPWRFVGLGTERFRVRRTEQPVFALFPKGGPGRSHRATNDHPTASPLSRDILAWDRPATG